MKKDIINLLLSLKWQFCSIYLNLYNIYHASYSIIICFNYYETYLKIYIIQYFNHNKTNSRSLINLISEMLGIKFSENMHTFISTFSLNLGYGIYFLEQLIEYNLGDI